MLVGLLIQAHFIVSDGLRFQQLHTYLQFRRVRVVRQVLVDDHRLYDGIRILFNRVWGQNISHYYNRICFVQLTSFQTVSVEVAFKVEHV